jgi:hypothetical protein
VGFAVLLGATVLGIAASAEPTGILPCTFILVGYLLAGIAAATVPGLLWPALLLLLPVVPLGGMAWLTYIGFTLPRTPAGRAARLVHDGGRK